MAQGVAPQTQFVFQLPAQITEQDVDTHQVRVQAIYAR
jgi:hypothetical protein